MDGSMGVLGCTWVCLGGLCLAPLQLPPKTRPGDAQLPCNRPLGEPLGLERVVLFPVNRPRHGVSPPTFTQRPDVATKGEIGVFP